MNDNPLRGFEPPEPPPGLREQTLRAGRTAFAAAPARDLWARLYASPAARLGWAASVVLLAALHLALPRRPLAVSPLTASAPRLDPEVAAIASLPRIREQATSAYSGEKS